MLKIYRDLVQGSDEWLAARLGLLTASEMKNIITPAKLQYASNDKERSHLYELAAQRITKYVEPMFVSDDMLRGKDDEFYARAAYSEKYGEVEQVGFITNDKWGFTLGYSPDGLIGEKGLIEIKSRRQKYQLETIANGLMPVEYSIQIQAGMLIAEREWLDFISYCGGMPMVIMRVLPDASVQEAILEVSEKFHDKLNGLIERYREQLANPENRLIPTERRANEITI